MSTFKFTRKHATVVAIASATVINIVIGLGMVNTLAQHKNSTKVSDQREITMDYQNVQPFIDSIRVLPVDQQRDKLKSAIKTQTDIVRYRALRLEEENEFSTGTRQDDFKVSILRDKHRHTALELFKLEDALLALDK